MSLFDIYPAIDLRRGRVVRLELGDPTRETVFGQANWAALRAIVGVGGAQVQFGGGLRTAADVAAALTAGVDRVVLGTAALESPDLLATVVAKFGAARLAVGIDARDGRVRVRGWQTESDRSPLDVALAARAAGVRTIIYTDIARDGVLTGVNAEATVSLAAASGLDVIASGGARDAADVAQLAELAPAAAPGRLVGVIIGRALYDGRIDLAQAIELVKRGESTDYTG